MPFAAMFPCTGMTAMAISSSDMHPSVDDCGWCIAARSCLLWTCSWPLLEPWPPVCPVLGHRPSGLAPSTKCIPWRDVSQMHRQGTAFLHRRLVHVRKSSATICPGQVFKRKQLLMQSGLTIYHCHRAAHFCRNPWIDATTCPIHNGPIGLWIIPAIVGVLLLVAVGRCLDFSGINKFLVGKFSLRFPWPPICFLIFTGS